MNTVESSHLRPEVSPSPDAIEFWEAAARHELVLPECRDCNRPFFYPRTVCPACGSRDLAWTSASGAGSLYSFCVHYHCAVPGLTDSVPFATALVDLAEGPRLMGFLLGAPQDPEQIRCGAPVSAEFIDLENGHTVLGFRLATPTDS